MADELAIRFSVLGLGQAKQAFDEVGRSAKKTAGQVADAGEETARSTSRLRESFGAVRRSLGDVSAALSGAAAIASIFARNNAVLQRNLEVLSLTLSGLGTAVRSVNGLFRGLTTLIGLKIVAVAALAAAVIFLVRNWDEALGIGRRIWQNFAAFLGRLWGAIVETAKGVGQIIAGIFTIDQRQIRAGVAQFQAGAGQLRAIAVDVGTQIGDKLRLAWSALTKLFGQDTAKGETLAQAMARSTQAWLEREQALADTIESTSARLAIQNMVVQEGIRRFEQIRDRVAQTREDKQALQQVIDRLKNSLIPLNEELRKTTRQYELQQALLQQRRGEWQLDTAEVEKATVAAREWVEQQALARELEEEIASNRRRLLLDTQQFADALADAARAQEDWNRQLEFDRRQTDQVETGLDRQLEAHRDRLALMDEGIEKRRAEIAGIEKLTAAIQAEIAALQQEIEAKIAAGIPTEALIAAQDRLRERLSRLAHEGALAARGLRDALLAPMREIAESLRGAFEGLFTDIMTGATSFGDVLLNFFRNLVNSIISIFSRVLATNIIRLLFPVFGFARGGIVPGGLIPAFAMQHGGIVDRPTLAMVGEGRSSEAVVPLPDNRSIPVTFTGPERDARPQEIVVRTTVVMDPRQIPPPQADEITNVVLMDIRSGGAVYREIRRAVGR